MIILINKNSINLKYGIPLTIENISSVKVSPMEEEAVSSNLYAKVSLTREWEGELVHRILNTS